MWGQGSVGWAGLGRAGLGTVTVVVVGTSH